MAKEKKQSTGFAIWFILIGFPIVGILGLQQLGAFRRISGLFSNGGGGGGGTLLAADVTGDVFDEFSTAIGVERAIRLTIVGLDDEYAISHRYDTRRGEAVFEVTPRPDASGLFPVLSIDAIRGIVSRGLHCYDPDGNELEPERRLFRKWEVESSGNSRDPGWSVRIVGIRPAGSIELRLGKNASSKFNVALPPIDSLSGLWKGRVSFDPDRGTVRINSFVMSSASSRKEGTFSEFKPNPDRNMPGFRVLYVTAGCVWLEIVYDRPSEMLLDRRRWPGVEIGYALFDDGSSSRIVKFEGGYQTSENNVIIFREKDRLILRKGDILAPNAVHFHYKGRDERTSADLLVITPPQN